ncbi:TATA-box-binding protein-like [Vanacampus margaritifer]
MKIRKPQTTARIFQSGILFCTGAKRSVSARVRVRRSSTCPSVTARRLLCGSEDESRVAARKFAFKILKLGYALRLADFEVLNIGGTCRTFPVNPEDLFLAQQDRCRCAQGLT